MSPVSCQDLSLAGAEVTNAHLTSDGLIRRSRARPTHYVIENLIIELEERSLPRTELRGMGKVTVVCGRNNSGKTTLLESIGSLSRESPVGRPRPKGSLMLNLAGDLAKRVEAAVEEECNRHSWNLGLAMTHVTRAWGEDLVDWVGLSEMLSRIGTFQGYTNLQNRVESILEQELHAFPTRVLVPAKRRVDGTVPFDGGGAVRVDPGGANLLIALFGAKNNPEGSDRHKYYGRLRSTFGVVTGGFDFDVTLDGGSLSLNFKPGGAGWGPAESFGLGLQDVLLILAVALSHDGATVLVEEPENHVHPAMQRRLLQVLRGETSNQYVISTHSNVFLDNAFVDRIFFSEFVDGEIRVGDVTSKASLLDDLGYEVTDNLTADVVVLVEGPTDVPVLETLALKRDDLRLKQFKFWPLGGDIMDQLDLTVLSDSNNILALVDDDPGSKRVRDRFVAKCEELGIPYHRLERYAIENYFTVDALREVYGGQFPDHVAKVTPRAKLEKQLGFNVKRRNRAIAEAMSYSDIEGTDLDAFFDLMAAVAR